MRMRKKKHLDERLERSGARLVREPFENKGSWRGVFGNDNPIHIEIGSGKGHFIAGMAKKHPDINFIAVDVIPDVILMGLELTDKEELPNLRFMIADATLMADMFEKGEIDRIYLNFSDPWKKKKQAKRRLTHQNFLNVYKRILKKDSAIWFKTDNRGLFEFSLNSFAADRDFIMSDISLDLHNSDFQDNIMTEYETKFSEMGMPIHRLVATLIADTDTGVNTDDNE